MKMTCKHDYHLHSFQSSCCKDPNQTTETIYDYALAHDYDSLCIADHLWDSLAPGASKWYMPQNVEHISEVLPLPTGKVPFYFGCETDYTGGAFLGVSAANYDTFDFIVIPLNHFHMEGFTRPAECNTPEKSAELYMARFEDIVKLDLPWRKIGFAHPTCRFLSKPGDTSLLPDVLNRLDYDRLRPCFDFFAKKGCGIELNGSTFSQHLQDERNLDVYLKIYRFARDCGCKFYCASDAHSPDALDTVGLYSARAAELLELREEDRYLILPRK